MVVELLKWFDRTPRRHSPQVNESMQMSRLSKKLQIFVLSFQWLIGSSDILVLVTTNFLSMTTSIKKSTSIFPGLCIKIYIYVVNFLLRFKPTNFSSFSMHKNSETKTVLTKFRPAIGASPLWTEAVIDHSICHLSLS